MTTHRSRTRSLARRSVFALLLGLAGAGLAAQAAPAPMAPVASFVTDGGQTVSTASFRGHRTLLWLVSTWCSSCAAGLQAMQGQIPALQKTGLRVVVLRNYRNDGYPGPGIRAFVAQAAPSLVHQKHWLLGQASAELDARYNPRHYPDVYYLIDADGRVQGINGAPSATMDLILRFARGSKR